MFIFKFRDVDTDAESYDGRHPHKTLGRHKRRKKGKHIDSCLKKRRHSKPLVLSVYWIMLEDTKAETKHFSA